MALSDIKGEAAFDFIADIIDPIVNIAADEDASRLFRREKCPDGMEPREFAAKKVREAVPQLMRAHKHDLAAIMAATRGVPVDEYVEGLTPLKLIGDVLELANDEEFQAFLS